MKYPTFMAILRIHNTATTALRVLRYVKWTEKLNKNIALVLILCHIENCFITFTFNTLQP
jgi:hypothetical protein